MTLSKTEIKLVEKLNKRYLKTVNQEDKIRKYRRRTDKLKQNSYSAKIFMILLIAFILGGMFYFYNITGLYVENKITEEVFYQKFSYLRNTGVMILCCSFVYIVSLTKKFLKIENHINEIKKETRSSILKDIRENSKLCFQVLFYLENKDEIYILNPKFKEAILILRNDEIKKEKKLVKIKEEKNILDGKMQEVMEAESELAYDKLLMYSEIENT